MLFKSTGLNPRSHRVITSAYGAGNLTRNQPRFASTSKLPRVAQPSLWQSVVPKSLRDGRKDSRNVENTDARQDKRWNPATTIFMLAILVGSQAIHLINVKNDLLNFSRKTDAKIALLREVLRRVQAGEDVSIEKVLGTGDPQSEAEWKEVVKELESDDRLWQEKQWKVKRREKKAAAAAELEEQIPNDGTPSVKLINSFNQKDEKPRFY